MEMKLIRSASPTMSIPSFPNLPKSSNPAITYHSCRTFIFPLSSKFASPMCCRTFSFPISSSLRSHSVHGSTTRMLSVQASSSLRAYSVQDEEIEDEVMQTLMHRAHQPLNLGTYKPIWILQLEKDVILIQEVFNELENENAQTVFYNSKAIIPFFLPSDTFNLNPSIWNVYFNHFLPAVVFEGENEEYPDTAYLDVYALQALSKAVHFGKILAEVKFDLSPELFQGAIVEGNRSKIEDLLSSKKLNKTTEERLLVKEKRIVKEFEIATAFESERTLTDLYMQHILPMRKEVQVQQLLLMKTKL